MPASLRAHVSRGMASSLRPYDRCSPTASPVQSVNLVDPQLPPAQGPWPDLERGPDTPPDHPGLPTYADYKRIEAEYLCGLSPRKRDKALITQAMFDKIWDVLHQPEACTIETPQFRFWVRKMFALSQPMWVGVRGDGSWGEVRVGAETGTEAYPDSDAEEADVEFERTLGDTSTDLFSAVVLHEHRPVAIMEQLYELFCYCHVRAGHGGRDKTCAVIRQHYSWVPKELTAQFVKACPTCASKRSGRGGVGVGMLVQREMSVSVVPSSLGSVGWPTTGGPLDPTNPEPCGVRERAWLRAREDAGTVDPSSLSAPRASRQVAPESCCSSESGGWSGVPPPFHLCDTTNQSGAGTTFGVHDNRSARTRRGDKRSATRNAECLDENAGLPSVLRPLRLSGPLPSEAASERCYPLQIDPVLLSLTYPGLSESDSASPGDAVQRDDGGVCHVTDVAGAGLCLPHRAPDSVDMESLNDDAFAHASALESSMDSSDASRGHGATACRRSTRRCVSRYGSGYRDGPLAMLYHCSADEAGQELDGTLSLSIMMDT